LFADKFNPMVLGKMLAKASSKNFYAFMYYKEAIFPLYSINQNIFLIKEIANTLFNGVNVP